MFCNVSKEMAVAFSQPAADSRYCIQSWLFHTGFNEWEVHAQDFCYITSI